MTGIEHGGRLSAWLEQAWLQRYLERQLDGEEQAWFEAYVMDKPELLDLIEADTALRDALAQGAARSGVSPDVAGTASDAGAALRTRAGGGEPGPGSQREGANAPSPPAAAARHASAIRRRERAERPRAGRDDFAPAPGASRIPPPLRFLALAATLVLGVGAGWLGREAAVPSSGLIGSPTRVVFDTERGAEAPPRVDHPRSGSAYIVIEAPVPPGARDVEFSIDGEATKVSASADGFVSLLAERRRLHASTRATLRYRVQDSRREQSWVLPDAATAPR